MKRLAGLFLVIISLFCTSTFAQELKLYRINDLVGDTIDVSEKEQYNLFPGISNFQSAIFFKTDTFYLSQINYLQNDTWKTDTLQLTAFDINKINHCINNADSIIAMINRDEAMKVAYNRFWQDIELKQFQKQKLETTTLKSREGRVFGTATGMMLGSAIGGVVGSQLGIEYVGGTSCNPIYRVNYPVFCGINCLTISAGTFLGYKLGEQSDQKKSPAMTELKEGKGWRTGLAIASAIPGTAIGGYLFFWSTVTCFGKLDDWLFADVEGGEFVAIPALLMGIGIATDITYLGYKLGKLIDHNRAVKTAKKNIKQNN
jgi:hypothetical protein